VALGFFRYPFITMVPRIITSPIVTPTHQLHLIMAFINSEGT
jgi:hypothetical protein